MASDIKDFFLDSFDDNILALENTMGFERNYALYLESKGRKEEANKHWQEYYKAKKELTNYKRKVHRERRLHNKDD